MSQAEHFRADQNSTGDGEAVSADGQRAGVQGSVEHSEGRPGQQIHVSKVSGGPGPWRTITPSEIEPQGVKFTKVSHSRRELTS